MADLEQDWQIMVGGWAKAGVAEAGCLENIFCSSELPHVLYFLYFGKIKKLSLIFLYLVDLSCIVLFFRYIAYQNESCLFLEKFIID